MADCSATRITIGGTVDNAEDLEALLDCVEADGAGLEYDAATRAEIVAAMLAATTAGQTLELSDDAAPGGLFQDTEACCKELGLSFMRVDDGHYTYGPSWTSWRGGVGIDAIGNMEQGPAAAIEGLAGRLAADGPEGLADHVRALAAAFAPTAPFALSGTALAAATVGTITP